MEGWVMKHFHDEVRIEAPIEHVWEFFLDTSHWEDWSPRSTYTDWSGPVDKVGITFVQKARFMGFEMKWTFTVVEVEPLRLIHTRTDTGPMDDVYRFERDGDATRLIGESDYELPGKMPGFIKDVMTKGWLERYMRQMMEDFKTLAEAKVPAHA
jgi:ligand-binding SRPBCC domain-containing protein